MKTYQTEEDEYALAEQPLEELIEKAVQAAAKGENVEQLLDVMLVSLPVALREKARKLFAGALAKRNLRTPSGEADIPSRATLARIRNALMVGTRQMMDRIAQLVRSRPDIAETIRQAGQVLASNGVLNDKVAVSETDLGTMAPLAGAARPQNIKTGRGA